MVTLHHPPGAMSRQDLPSCQEGKNPPGTDIGIRADRSFPLTPRNPDLTDALMVTLRKIEESGEFSQRDPVLLRFKGSILRLIADLENKEREHDRAA